MPYVTTGARVRLMRGGHPQTAGELNYILTLCVLEYIRNRGESYQTYCEVEGVLGHMGRELYRRRTGPYEDQKIEDNTDVEGYARS